MRQFEIEFLEAVTAFANRWPCDINHYTENNHFCIDVTFDMDDWGLCADEMWTGLSNVAKIHNANIDSDLNNFYLGLYLGKPKK